LVETSHEGKVTMLWNQKVQTDRTILNHKIRKYKDLIIDIQRMWNVKTKNDCSRIKIIQKVPEQHTGKTRHQGATENSNIGNCTQTNV
jgi:hypothetical protein